jgi:hypothetical protein
MTDALRDTLTNAEGVLAMEGQGDYVAVRKTVVPRRRRGANRHCRLAFDLILKGDGLLGRARRRPTARLPSAVPGSRPA